MCEVFNQARELAARRGLAGFPQACPVLGCSGTTCELITTDNIEGVGEGGEDAAAEAALRQCEGKATVERFYGRLEKTRQIIYSSS